MNLRFDSKDKYTTQLIGETWRRVRALERSDQPVIGSWYDMNVSMFSYSSDDVLEVSADIAIADFFQVGDRIRIYQEGGDKYFAIWHIDEDTRLLSLISHSSDSFTTTFNSSAFTGFAVSKDIKPDGFPVYFRFTPTLSVPAASTLVVSNQGIVDSFFMINRDKTMRIKINRVSATLGGTADNTLRESLPIRPADIELTARPSIWMNASFGSLAILQCRTVIADPDRLYLTRIGSSNFPTGSFSHYVDMDFAIEGLEDGILVAVS